MPFHGGSQAAAVRALSRHPVPIRSPSLPLALARAGWLQLRSDALRYLDNLGNDEEGLTAALVSGHDVRADALCVGATDRSGSSAGQSCLPSAPLSV